MLQSIAQALRGPADRIPATADSMHSRPNIGRQLQQLVQEQAATTCSVHPATAAAGESSVTTFYMVRHGETDWNKRSQFQGQINSQLNDAGRRQAQLAAAAMASWPCDAVVASPLDRTRHTSWAIKSNHPHVSDGAPAASQPPGKIGIIACHVSCAECPSCVSSLLRVCAMVCVAAGNVP